jgi:membrane protease YdiL (CAAX protease family)
MIQFAIDLWSFTKKRNKDIISSSDPFKNKLSNTFNAFAFYFIIALILLVLTNGLNEVIKHFYGINLSTIRNNNIKKAVNNNSFLIIAFAGPILEEILFRLWLSFKRIDLAISSFFISLIAITKYNHGSLYTDGINDQLLYHTIFAILVGSMLFALLNIIPVKESLSHKNFYIVYWISCTAFALSHLLNFIPLKSNLIFVYPLLVLPQFILGYILGYVRLRNGFFWALLMHCAINLPAALLLT